MHIVFGIPEDHRLPFFPFPVPGQQFRFQVFLPESPGFPQRLADGKLA